MEIKDEQTMHFIDYYKKEEVLQNSTSQLHLT
jgi:hypothetical protein